LSYHIPSKAHEILFEEKKSKFYAFACFVDSREQAIASLAGRRKAYPDARHHCWAYLLGNPTQAVTQAMSDDGEPSGTAGKPILNVLQHGKIGNVIVVVSRYFGGIKLGAGGLVRAYSNAANVVLQSIPTQIFVEKSSLKLSVSFGQENEVRQWLMLNNGHIEAVSYLNEVQMTVNIPANLVQELKSLISPY
jgi:uncharacterized YigZ family protein